MSKVLKIPALLWATASLTWAVESNVMAPVNGLAEAEKNFARAALKQGIRESFLQNFADEGLVFAPNPKNAKAFYAKYDDKGRRLIWEPIFATISNSGELGFTTGPWEMKKSAADQTSLAFGQFVSVWKKQVDHSWKVVVDVGIDHPQPPSGLPGDLQLSPPNENQKRADDTAQKEALARAEKILDEGLKVDAGAALLAAGADDMRIFRSNAFPAVGRTAARLMLGAEHEKTTRNFSGGGMSDSCDLAYRYGSYSSQLSGGREQGYYLTLWSTDLKGAWKILLDLQTKNGSNG